MNENCCICMEKLVIPVEFTCFSCFSFNQIGCSSFCRVCLACATSFLQLDKDVEQRDYTKKCLYCPGTVSLSQITAKRSLRKDFTLMLLDNSSNGCPFCNNFVGTQIILNHHIEKECPKYYMQCSCHRVFKREDFYFHLFSCSAHLHCNLCTRYVLKNQYMDHMYHAHEYSLCHSCQQFIKSPMLNNHAINDCRDRFVVCDYCKEMCRFKNYKDHLEDHLNAVTCDIREMNVSYQDLVAKYRQLKTLLNPFNTALE